MTDGPDFLAEAADELVIAATRYQHKRRSQRRAATGAASAMIIAVGGLIGLGVLRSNDADANRVTVASGAEGFQEVTIDERAPADEMIAELERAGINVETKQIPVGPSRVGKATSISSSSGQITAGVYRVTAGSVITVEIGVPAPPGVEYIQPSTDVFATGEPLHCLGAVGSDAAALAARVPDDVDVSWFRGPGDSSPISEDDLAGTVVIMASSNKANTVSINVVEGNGPAEPPSC